MADNDKRVSEVLDYDFDFAPVTNSTANDGGDYLDAGETLTSKVVTVTGATMDSDVFFNANTSVKVWVSSGAANTEAVIVCSCVTSGGRTVTRATSIKIIADNYI
ncbi:MAG: hypothetical protein OEM38_00385 [Gammaproteobacteria bacterium]|nr:hypothetical protein [Gammaproteobacteria bacterium]